MGRVSAFCQSLVGKKVIMAVTGVILFLFVVGHLLGNLQIFAGPERLNTYSAFLKGLGEILWAVRVVLLAALILHFSATGAWTSLNDEFGNQLTASYDGTGRLQQIADAAGSGRYLSLVWGPNGRISSGPAGPLPRDSSEERKSQRRSEETSAPVQVFPRRVMRDRGGPKRDKAGHVPRPEGERGG
jgi:YD repeat-containing protein